MFKHLFKKKQATPPSEMEIYANWAVENLTASDYLADYSLESIADLDRFVEEEGQAGGYLTQSEAGIITYAIACYLGETALVLYGGQWQSDDADPDKDINLAVNLSNGQVFYPVQAIVKRQKFGESHSLYNALLNLTSPVAEEEVYEELDQTIDLSQEPVVMEEVSSQADVTNDFIDFDALD